MDIKQMKENKLKIILQFSIPSIIAMLLQTVITITDGYFTGNYVGDNALAAINLGLPILYVYLGAGLCVGVGGSVISGRFLGAKNKQKASEVFSQTMVTAVAIGVIISLIVFMLFTPILGVLRAEGELSGYFTDYYRIMLFTSYGAGDNTGNVYPGRWKAAVLYDGEYCRMYTECRIGLYFCSSNGTGGCGKCGWLFDRATDNSIGATYLFHSAQYNHRIQSICF